MRFAPISENEIMEFTSGNFLLTPGDCRFIINNAELVKSKSGNEMIKLELNVCDRNDRKSIVFDYLLNTESAKWKLIMFAKCVKVEHQLLQGILKPDALIGKKASLVIKHEEYNGEKQNRVARYIVPVDTNVDPFDQFANINTPSAQKATGPDVVPNDDIPF